MFKKFMAAALAAFMLLGMAGCGMSTESYAEAPAEGAYAAEEAYAEEEYAEDALAEEYIGGFDESGNSLTDAGDSEPSVQEGQKIIYTGNITLETLKYDDTVKSVKAKIKQYGGIINTETETDNDWDWYYAGNKKEATRNYYVVVMIPSERFQEFMSGLSEDGKIRDRTINAENITKSYNDKSAYIESLQKELDRLLEMMDKAENMEDMITIESRIAEVQYLLNTQNSELSDMDMKVRYSTLYLNINEVSEYSAIETPSTTFGERVSRAFGDSWKGFVSFCQGFVIFIIIILPFAFAAAVVVVIILLIRRSRFKKHPELAAERDRKKAEKRALKERKKERKRAMKSQIKSPMKSPAPDINKEENDDQPKSDN
ncbi:MAG: DUF4349 domain-containing protein [Lachnospiraceae bacterium]